MSRLIQGGVTALLATMLLSSTFVPAEAKNNNNNGNNSAAKAYRKAANDARKAERKADQAQRKLQQAVRKDTRRDVADARRDAARARNDWNRVNNFNRGDWRRQVAKTRKYNRPGNGFWNRAGGPGTVVNVVDPNMFESRQMQLLAQAQQAVSAGALSQAGFNRLMGRFQHFDSLQQLYSGSGINNEEAAGLQAELDLIASHLANEIAASGRRGFGWF